MKHVDIFITHNMTGMKAERAAYVYVISAGTSKGEATYTGFGVQQDATVNRINLAALNQRWSISTVLQKSRFIQILLPLQAHLIVGTSKPGKIMVFKLPK